MNKLSKLFLFVLAIVGTFMGITKVNAETYAGQIKGGPYVGGPYYVMHTRGSNKFWLTGQFIVRSSDGHFVYCVQPMVKINSDSTYDVRTEDVEAVLNMSLDEWNVINKIAYYGYGYKDETHDHTDDRYYLAAQMLIWKHADPTVESYFTDTLNGNRNDSILKQQMDSIMDLVNSHYTRPSFENMPNEMSVGETISVNDSKNVLKYYEVTEVNNGIVSKNGNTLNITATTNGKLSFNLSKMGNRYGNKVEFYYATNSQNVMRRGNIDPIRVPMNINVYGGSITIKKTDSETGSQTPQGEASLEGATYGLFKENGERIQTIVTDRNGNFKTDNILSLGRYYVLEEKASKGYLVDNNKYYFDITKENLNPEINVYEKVIKNHISILKQYDYVDGTTQFLNAESGIKFEVYNSKNQLVDTITTDKNGYANIDLPYGVYKLHQVNSNTGFEKIFDFYVTVDENSNQDQYYNILNNKISAYLQLLKRDSETCKLIALADTTFKIINTDTNQYVTQYVGGKVLSEFKTDNEGKMVTYLKLEAGNYKIVEIKSPKGYLLNSDGVNFSIGNDTYLNYTTYGAFVTVDFINSPIKGQVEVNKIGEQFIAQDEIFKYVDIKLDNIKFEIYAEEDIKSSDGNHLYYEKGTLVDTITTNKDGYAISKKLPLGKYYLIEISTKDNYILDNNKYSFELTEKDNKTAIVYKRFDLKNQLKKGELDFTKTDFVNGEPIKDTIIEIYNNNDQLIYTGTTDKDGKVKIKELSVGKYYIIEKEAATGYIITDKKVYFEIKNNNEVVKAEMKNKPITGELEFTKTDLTTSEGIPNTIVEIYNDKDELLYTKTTDEEGKFTIKDLRYGKYYIIEKEAATGYVITDEKIYFEIKNNNEIVKAEMKNKKITGTLEFTKVDLSTSEPLPNTVIEIYNEKDELIFTKTTDENGKVIIENLEYGKYYILEKNAPEGYEINPEKMEFEIKEDGVIVKSIMEDQKIEVPNTEKNNYIIPITLLLMGVATGVVIYEEIKKKRK